MKKLSDYTKVLNNLEGRKRKDILEIQMYIYSYLKENYKIRNGKK